MFEEPAPIHGLSSKNVKRLAIKRRHVDYGDDGIQVLMTGVTDVVQGRAYSIEHLYQTCERVVGIGRRGQELYERLRKEWTSEVDRVMQSLDYENREWKRLQYGDRSGREWLHAFLQQWRKWMQDAKIVASFLLYLDRSWVLSARARPCLALALDLFRESAANRNVIRHLVIQLCEVIADDRLGRPAVAVTPWIEVLDQLGYYDDFENEIVAETSRWCATFPPSADRLAAHFALVAKIRQAERERCLSQLLPRSSDRIDRVIVEVMVERSQSLLIEGFKTLADEQSPALVDMYRLLGKNPSLLQQYSQYCLGQGRKLILDTSQDANMVENLLTLKHRLDAIVASFSHDDDFANAEREAFSKFLNERQNKPAEMVAKWIDSKLRSRTQEAELQSALRDVLFIFRYIQGKDTFEAFYKRDFAKRLLLNRSSSSDAERSMLNMLRSECGAAFTANLEGMFKDVSNSEELMQGFQQSRAATSLPLGISVNVLTMGNWPTYTQKPANLTPEMIQSLEIFRAFYTNKHAGRTLSFQNSLAHCILTAWFGSRRYELEISLYQALVLLLFNEHDRLSFDEIQSATGIEPEELKRTLLSVSVGKERLLRKKPHSPVIENDHVFHFNPKYESTRTRIRVNQIQAKETVEENVATHEQVFADRQFTVDAAIVRIMKSKKKVKHQLLIAELFEQLKFPMATSDIKKRISSLVDRDYMERDEDDPQTYIYLA